MQAPGVAREFRTGYVICTTQRSGSNYLCSLLASTGLLGRPLDYFNPAGRRAKGWPDYPGDLDLQLGLIPERGSSANGIYGLKAFAEHLDALVAARWTERLPELHWIYLRRDDLLAQAISLVIAKQTGQWRSNATAFGAAKYDARAIAEELAAVARDEARWRIYFASHGLRPLEFTYEALLSDSQSAVDAIAALMSLEAPANIDAARIDVAIQRDGQNREWRERFLRRPAAVPALAALRSPRLTVSILTKDGQERLPRLLREAREYADEIVVGVDASSSDNTLAVAAAGADVVYQFRLPQPGQLAPARLLVFDYATGDWILTLDDDESMESSFDALAPELMRAAAPTHFWFPRKWIVNDDPYEYIHAPPWFPNWSPRMFRNDRSLVWKPPEPHSTHHLQGPGYYDARTSILHFEPLVCSPERRAEKVTAYRNAGARGDSEDYYDLRPAALRRPVQVRNPPTGIPPPAAAVVPFEVRSLVAERLPPWSAAFICVDMPEVVQAGEAFVVQATVRNTGGMAWTQQYAQWPANQWPMLRLGYFLFHADGRPAEPHDGARMMLPRFVAPGERVTFIERIVAPADPGRYVIAWDMVSEGHCWFAERESNGFRSRLTVL